MLNVLLVIHLLRPEWRGVLIAHLKVDNAQ